MFWFNIKLFFTSHHDIINEKPTKLSHIYVYLWALYQILVSCQSIHIRSRTTIFSWTFPCLAFQFICRTWESLTFDMFSEDEEVSIRLWGCFTNRAVARCLVHISQFKYQETWIAWWASPKAGDCFTSDEFEQCMWHVTCDIITSWYVTVSHTDMGYVRYIVMLTFVHLQEVVEVRIGSG